MLAKCILSRTAQMYKCLCTWASSVKSNLLAVAQTGVDLDGGHVGMLE